MLFKFNFKLLNNSYNKNILNLIQVTCWRTIDYIYSKKKKKEYIKVVFTESGSCAFGVDGWAGLGGGG